MGRKPRVERPGLLVCERRHGHAPIDHSGESPSTNVSFALVVAEGAASFNSPSSACTFAQSFGFRFIA